MTHPTFEESPDLRDACLERCAEFGDPPCWRLRADLGDSPSAVDPDADRPCGECLRDVGIEPGDEFDENAAIGRLV